MLDLKLTQLGLKLKNMVVLDLNFPRTVCSSFRASYEPRFIHAPCRQGMALEMAGGLASFGKLVVLLGYEGLDLHGIDPTLNVKILKHASNGSWEDLEERLRAFGPAFVEIPELI